MCHCYYRVFGSATVDMPRSYFAAHRRVLRGREVSLIGFLLLISTSCLAGDRFEWKPFTPDELAMKENPVSPGGSAVILDWDVFNDDIDNTETVYYRVKIFDDTARSEGNIEIPFVRGVMQVKEIQARTVHPDGTVIPFGGEVFEKTIVKSRQVRYLAKTFSLPDVQAGSLLEYRYRLKWDSSRLFDSHWELEQKLPVRHARFQIRPYTSSKAFTWSARNVPPGTAPIKQDGKIYSLQLHNVAAFVEEAFSPPEGEIKARIDLFYSSLAYSDPDRFWKEIGDEWSGFPETFAADRRYVRELAASLVQPSDSPETKLRKLYARALQVRNLSYEPQKTTTEIKQEKLKDSENIEDILKHGYGYNRGINLVFLGLARAAGFEAHEVVFSSREKVFFRRDVQNSEQLERFAVEVKMPDGQYCYFDPGTKYTPFGMLYWNMTGVAGLRLQSGGGTLISSPNPAAKDSLVERKATVQWSDDGLKGDVTVSYHGQDALIKRVNAISDDENTRRKELEDEMKSWLAEGAKVKLKSATGWDNTDDPLTATFSIELPNFGASTGQRLILPLDIFASHTHPAFQHEKRKLPVYFSYPYEEYDQVLLQLPQDYEVEKLPANAKESSEYGRYGDAWTQQGGMITMQRRFALDWFYFQPEQYGGLRDFFNKVHNSDQGNVILHAKK